MVRYTQHQTAQHQCRKATEGVRESDCVGRSERTEDRREQGGLHMLHMPTQEEDPPNSTSKSYQSQPLLDNREPKSPNHHQMVRNHIRLKAFIQATHTAPSKQRGSWMPADARKHNQRAEPPEHGDPL